MIQICTPIPRSSSPRQLATLPPPAGQAPPQAGHAPHPPALVAPRATRDLSCSSQVASLHHG